MPYTPNLPVGGCVEQAHLRTGTAELYGGGDAVRVFAVRAPNATNDESYALYHGSIPALRSLHPTRSYLWCSQKTARQADDKSGCIWEVLCNYTLAASEALPWNEPAVYAWGAQATEQIVEYDVVTAKPVRNSAGAPFDPGVSATRYEAVLTVSRNQTTYNESTALAYIGAVNNATFYGSPRGYCMCTGITATSQTHVSEAGVKTPYWAVQFNFAFRNTSIGYGWQPKILDAGYCKKATSGALIPITIAGREPSSPVPLDGSGQPLAHPETDTPVWLDFKVYPEANFSALGI